jgi:Caspase domain
MSLTRRELIQRVSLLSAGLWASDIPLVHRYQRALAQSTPRKLALLVGLNQYSRTVNVSALKGCVTDVELHRELLVHRFGFRPSDVLALTDEEATRSNIEAAFTTHLLEQARPGDVVVFHFSGYGCLVRTKSSAEGGTPTYDEQQALLATDAWLPNPVKGEAPLFNGIYEDTLFLLLRSLPTDQVTTLLDVGIQPSLELRCKSLRERALPPWQADAFSIAELAFQDRLLQQTQLTRDQVKVQRESGQVPGLVLAAAAIAQPTALELDRKDFSAGLFSYALMQQLWTNIPETTITIQFGRISSQMAQRIGPSPSPLAKGQKSFGSLPWSTGFFAIPHNVGVVTSTDRRGQTAKLWLGGMPEALLAVYQAQSCFRCMNPPILLQMRSRQGWTAIAQHVNGPPLQEGLFLEEAIRVLPRSLTLKLALGSNLERIERVDATSIVSVGKRNLQVVGTAQSADYIFTKLPAPTTTQKPDASNNSSLNAILEPLPAASYGLAYLGGAILPNTIGDRGEVVKLALQRLLLMLDTLLAIKLLDLTINDTATPLRVSATLEQLDDLSQPLIRLQTPGAPPPQPIDETTEAPIPKADKTSKTLSIPNGTAIQYRVSNWNDFPVYVWVVGVDSGTTVFASYATDSTSPTPEQKPTLKPLIIQPGTSVVLPNASQTWKASTTAGLNKTFIFCTREPLLQTLVAQNNTTKSTLPGAPSGFTQLSRPLPVVQKIFEDLHQASLPTTSTLGITAQNVWALETQTWATLQFVYATG